MSSTVSDTFSVESGHRRMIAEKIRSSKPGRTATAFWRNTEGYHFGVRLCAILSAVVFSVNVLTTIWASSHYGTRGGFGKIQQGDCKKTAIVATRLHLMINVFSTLLLGASNYTMQCLSSPTREEIDKAHRQRVWLDIGISGLRNLRRISWPRLCLWWIVALTSLPLHLLYNSAIFSTLSAREFSIYLVSQDFTKGAPFDEDSLTSWASLSDTYEQHMDPIFPSRLHSLQQNSTNFHRRDLMQCINNYAGQKFTSNHGDVLFVSAHQNATNSLLGFVPTRKPG